MVQFRNSIALRRAVILAANACWLGRANAVPMARHGSFAVLDPQNWVNPDDVSSMRTRTMCPESMLTILDDLV